MNTSPRYLAHVLGHSQYENLRVLLCMFGISGLFPPLKAPARSLATASLHLSAPSLGYYLLQTEASLDQNRNNHAYA